MLIQMLTQKSLIWNQIIVVELVNNELAYLTLECQQIIPNNQGYTSNFGDSYCLRHF